MKCSRVVFRGLLIVALCVSGLGGIGQAYARIDGIELICPCELVLNSETREANATFGVRNFRPTSTGPLRLVVGIRTAPGQYVHIPVPIEPLPADSSLLRRRHSVAGVSRVIEDSSDPENGLQYLELYEANQDAGSSLVDQVLLAQAADNTSPSSFRFGNLDFLTDGDSDGVADANERLAGTDPDDPQVTPGASTVDMLALYDEIYAAQYGHAPHVRIHHLFTVANLAFVDSGTNIRLRMVGASAAAPEEPEHYWSPPAEDVLTEASELHGADLTVYFKGPNPDGFIGGWADLGGAGGRGYMPASEGRVLLATIFYRTPAIIVAHEIGHLMGLVHSFALGDENGAFRWSRGHFEQNILRGTIMSYGSGYNLRFSDPDVDCWGFGLACGAPRQAWHGADAVASLDASRFQVARYRQAKPDSDGDNIVDVADAFPQNAAEWRDTDGDGIGDRSDTDDDGDGFADDQDVYPLDPREWADVDADGIGDNADDQVIESGEEFLIEDPALRIIVEEALGFSPGTPIDASDMETLTTLRGDPSGVASLEGLQYARNLEHLTLWRGRVSDLSPLSGLDKLVGVHMGYHVIRDLSPLVGLPSLRSLSVPGNLIGDLSPIAGMTELRNLGIGGNHWTDEDLQHLNGLMELQSLDLANSEIGSIAALANLPQLRDLSLGGNRRLRDIRVVSNFPKLERFYIGESNVSDISPLGGLTSLRYLGISEVPATDLTPILGLVNLRELVLGQMGLSDMSMFTHFRNLQRLSLRRNNFTSLAELIESDVLADDAELDLTNNPLSRETIENEIPLLEARGITVRFSAAEFEVPDDTLRSALAAASGTPGQFAFRRGHIRQVRALDLAGLGITNLSGLEHATNLQFLNLAGNGIEDLSPLLELALLEQLALSDARLNDPALQEDIDALRAQGVDIVRSTSQEDLAALDNCQAGMVLGEGESCAYPGAEARFSIVGAGLATFAFGTFAESLKVQGAINGAEYDFAASRYRDQDWRIERVGGQGEEAFAQRMEP